MSKDFGVGFRAKVGIAILDQLFLERLIIFDHTVVHEREFTAGVKVGVRVFIGHFAMRGPACMTDPEVTRHRFLRHYFCKCRDTSGAFARFEAASVHDRNTGGIVAAIF